METQKNLDGKQQPTKTENQFNENVRQIQTLFNGLFQPKKVSKDQIEQICDELFEEERKEKAEKLKQSLKDLVKEKIAFDKYVDEQQKAFAKAKEEKLKAFNEKANQIKNQIEDFGSLLKELEKTTATILTEENTNSEEETTEE